MQVREENQAGPEMFVLGLLRFFHFHHQIGLAPDFGRALHDGPARLHVLAIGNGAALAGLGFHQYLVARLPQGGDAAGHQPDARLVVFDLFRNADDHGSLSPEFQINTTTPWDGGWGVSLWEMRLVL